MIRMNVVFFLSYFLISQVFADWTVELKNLVAQNQPPQWMTQQIANDFADISAEDLKADKLESTMTVDRYVPLARYQVRNNFVQAFYSTHFDTTRAKTLEYCFKELAKHAPLPNIDFIVCFGDDCSELNKSPVLAFAANSMAKKHIILMPDFEALSGSSSISQVQQAMKYYPWEKKIPMAYWRGAMTGAMFTKDNFLNFPRSQLVSQSLQYPHLIDARYTDVCQTHEPQAILQNYGMFFSKRAPVTDAVKYKYQILVDGNSCAYSRALWQLFSDGLIFKHYSPNIQWYYKGLQTGVHYVEVDSHFKDLPEKIMWAEAHQDEVRKIIANAQNFAQQNLKLADIYYYLYLVLQEYARIQES